MIWRLPENETYELHETVEAGRGVFARRKLTAGTHILTTSPDLSPIAHVILRDYRKEACAWCFAYNRGREWKLRRYGIAYCSEECYAHWIKQNQEKIRVYEALQKAKPQLAKLTTWAAGRSNSADPDIANFILSDNGSESLMELVGNPDVFKSASLSDHVQAYHFLLTFMDAQAERCQELISRASHNAFSIRPNNDGQQSGEFLGYGVWPEASFFNHSCRPNLRKERRGRLWLFWADEEVEEGEELCITYLGGDEKDLGVEERRRRLQDEWGFRCCCTRCIEEGGN